MLIDPRHSQHLRWGPGERMDSLFEQVVDDLAAQGRSGQLAVDTDDEQVTFAELDARGNQLARQLRDGGVRPGDRVALLLDRPVATYVAMLGICKADAAYVPLDAAFPPDRLAFLCADADVTLVLSNDRLSGRLSGVDVAVWRLDELTDALASQPRARLAGHERSHADDSLAYVIYTSGTTGRPKGVAIAHSSICNFLRVAAEVYGYDASDRVYQGMTVAFDFSVEELWVPWMVGATLVPKPVGGALVGQDLHDFLIRRRISALCCVPTLLASMEHDVPGLRFLLVSGESCPHDLVVRWHRDDRRFLNVYGPTEATVTATWTPLLPDRKVTIGVPLPTYAVLLRDPDTGAEVPDGQPGEICVGGIALSTGYLNRPDLTDKAFIPDTFGVPGNPSGRLYRTGDLGRIDERGEVEFLGRIDLQVKIRGYRVELNEIESVIMEYPGVAVAVVEPHRPEPGVVELATWYSVRSDTRSIDPRGLQQFLRDRLPGYMVPAHFQRLDAMPMLPSDKVDRKNLPPLASDSRLVGDDHVPPEGPVEFALADALADLLRLPRVSATAHFFDDLGADSLVMAKFCSRIRQVPGGWSPVMKDVYVQPTVRLLAAALAPDGDVLDAAPPAAPAASGTETAPLSRKVSSLRYAACGAAQVAVFAAISYVVAQVLVWSAEWLVGATEPLDVFVRSVGLTFALLAFTLVTPVAAKWVLIGRWTPRAIDVWSVAYLRFWAVRLLLGISPARLFVGSPFYSWYLRALGAKVGPRVTIHSPGFLCTDLLTIGADTVIQKDAVLLGYRVEDGVIQTGRLTVGANASIGESTVLDIDTGVGDDAQLGHASGLLRGQRIPAGERWGGLPAEPMDADFQQVPPARWHPGRPVVFTVLQIVWPALLGALVPALMLLAIRAVPESAPLLEAGHLPWSEGGFLGFYAVATATVLLGGLLLSLLFVWTVPRLFHLVVKPGRVYPLFGVHHFAQRMVTRLTNTPFTALFGDSSYVTGFLSRLGYRLSPLIQTGSNFGMAVRHDNPYLVSIGWGTMISDGLSLHNAEYSPSSFRVRPTVLGRNSFLGNAISYPAGARLGDNVLLGTKVMVPVSGEVRHDTGLLGSPAFAIPRSVQRDAQFNDLRGKALSRQLRRKRRYNTATIGWSLLLRWLQAALIGGLLLLAVDLVPTVGTWILALHLFLAPALGAGLSILAERLTFGFRRLTPRLCSIYDPYFWKHERFWKLSGGGPALFNGTPLKAWVWRALGVRVGRRLFDDGCGIVERSLVSIGDDCTLNRGSTIQAHSLEDGAFKSDHIVLGDRVTVGVSGFLHYGITVADGAVIEADSFVMKGAEIEAGERWFGNPAHPGGRLSYAPAGTRRLGTEASLVDRLRAPGVRDILAAGVGVSVHVFSLSACAQHQAELDAWLPAADRREAESIASPSRRARFAASRALVPLLMHLHRDVPAVDADPAWGLTTDPGGAPTVWGPEPVPEINISYAEDLVAIGFGRRREVGIDLATPGDDTQVVPEALTDAERDLLASLRPRDRAWTFLKMWTLKEALSKCTGQGAALDFASLDTAAHLPTLTQAGGGESREVVRFHHRTLWHRGRRYWLAVAARPVADEAPRRARTGGKPPAVLVVAPRRAAGPGPQPAKPLANPVTRAE